MVTVKSVLPGSPAAKKKILPGDILISLNGHDVNDVLDYRFYLAEEKIDLLIHRGPELLNINIKKEEYSDIGLEFDTFLMDQKRSCKNKCVFCFIDQLPCGMRDTLYFKDDDSRLSFLQGNYVTMTNMKNEDLDRIIKMRMSPVNISVHTTDPVLRVKMMKNPAAAKINEQMKMLAEAGIEMNCQLVICKNINDGENLGKSMRDLAMLYPQVTSVSVVPAGLTCHREGLFPLEPYTPEESAVLISQVNAFGDNCKKELESRLFYCADEFYIKAGLPLPGEDYYEGYPQLENGVGLMSSMETEFDYTLSDLSGFNISKKRSISIATGYAAYGYICRLVEKLKKVCYNLDCKVYRIKNDYFGENITVAGLICGCDIVSQLTGKELGERLLLPQVMLRSEGDLFLDGESLTGIEEKLRVPVSVCRNDGEEFIKSILL